MVDGVESNVIYGVEFYVIYVVESCLIYVVESYMIYGVESYVIYCVESYVVDGDLWCRILCDLGPVRTWQQQHRFLTLLACHQRWETVRI